MSSDRYVVLGLAAARSSWFGALAQWANSGTIPVEFVKCVSAEELRARLVSGRPFSAVVADGSLPALDRDLVETARGSGCPVIAVDNQRGPRDWAALGVAGVLPEFFDPACLVEVLSSQAVTIGRGEALPGHTVAPTAPAWKGRVAVVCGPGGTGASTVAVALAQGLARPPTPPAAVLLADLVLHAEQAMLHDARDVVPGVQELVEAHRSRRLSAEEVRAFTFAVEERRYSLLLGLRRARNWATIRPRAFEASFDALQAAYQVVVCDTGADLEGEEEGGSIEVEERHLMARAAARRADVAFAVGQPGMKGLHALVRVLNELWSAGVDAERIVPVVNRAPKGARARSEMSATVAALARASGRSFAPTLFLPDKRVEEALRDGVRLPAPLADPLVGAFRAVVDHQPRLADAHGPVAVRAGSLGVWPDDETEEASLG